MFLEPYHWWMGRYSNMNQSSRAATENFVFLNAANNGSLKNNFSLSQERDCLPQGRKTASLKFDLLD